MVILALHPGESKGSYRAVQNVDVVGLQSLQNYLLRLEPSFVYRERPQEFPDAAVHPRFLYQPYSWATWSGSASSPPMVVAHEE
jgi:hypothetical protein